MSEKYVYCNVMYDTGGDWGGAYSGARDPGAQVHYHHSGDPQVMD